MVPQHLQDLPRVAHGPGRQQEEQPGVAPGDRLPHDPPQGRQDVGAAHVSPHPPEALAGDGQALLPKEQQSQQPREAGALQPLAQPLTHLAVAPAGGEQRLESGAEAHDVEEAGGGQALQEDQQGILGGRAKAEGSGTPRLVPSCLRSCPFPTCT